MGREAVDAIVIGSGQGGGPLATALAAAGRKTVLAERAHVGGTCVNEGCTPTKTMVASARVAHLVARSADYGVVHGESCIRLAVVRERKRAMVRQFRETSEKKLRKQDGLELIFGEARFTGPRQVVVSHADGDREFEAGLVVINTGTRPAPAGIEGLVPDDVLDSTSIMELADVPAHLLVVGGGYVGVEFAQMFRRFGSEVTIVQRSPHLLDREDEDVSRAVEEILNDDGVRVLTEAIAESGSRQRGGIELMVTHAGTSEPVYGSHLLMAAGRVANTDALDCGAGGVDLTDRGFVAVDSKLATSAEGTFALGDVAGGPMFTHISYDDYRILRDNLLRNGRRTTDDRLVPYTVFTDPQLGRVGLSERQAREQGRKAQVFRMPMSHVARALETDETRGFLKALVDADSGEILGCAILGAEGGEIMSQIQLAMMGGLTARALRDGVFAHPLFAESLNNLFAET